MVQLSAVTGSYGRLLLASLLFLCGCGGLARSTNRSAASGANASHAAVEPSATPTNSPAAAASDEAALKEISPGIFQLGAVRIDRRQRSLSFPAKVELTEGPMEYFLVSTWGKTYESIFSTETEPQHIHIAMLLLGARGAGTNLDATLENTGSIVSHPSPIRLPGDPVAIEMKWIRRGKEIRKSAEELVFNSRAKKAPAHGNWVYNGSFMVEATFIAEREGSIVSLVTDPQALINNVGAGHDDDSIWRANPGTLPPTNTIVEVTIRLGKLAR